ncbi:lipase family protein [Mycobacterium sp. D16R24]|nr:lipase family protein [Mycobacterium sp. D16R24]
MRRTWHTPLPANAPVGFWGYSGGGTASTWAAEMAPVYGTRN